MTFYLISFDLITYLLHFYDDPKTTVKNTDLLMNEICFISDLLRNECQALLFTYAKYPIAVKIYTHQLVNKLIFASLFPYMHERPDFSMNNF